MTRLWAELISIEPQLEVLRKEAAAVDGSDRNFCANAVWYHDFKPRLKYLAGWWAQNPALRSEQAYDLATRTIYRELPPCRECTCM